jgi:hypothetical protein
MDFYFVISISGLVYAHIHTVYTVKKEEKHSYVLVSSLCRINVVIKSSYFCTLHQSLYTIYMFKIPLRDLCVKNNVNLLNVEYSA